MNTPTHIVCGACLAQALALVCLSAKPTRSRVAVVAVGAIGIGVVSHLLLDLIPHCAWVAYLNWFKPLPFDWLIQEAVFGLAVAIPALMLAGRLWPYVALGMFGGMYSDLEKVLSLEFHVPNRFILFKWHSTYLSHRTGGLPEASLIVIECLLIAGFLLAMWRMKKAE